MYMSRKHVLRVYGSWILSLSISVSMEISAETLIITAIAYLHIPNPETPIEETMRALKELQE